MKIFFFFFLSLFLVVWLEEKAEDPGEKGVVFGSVGLARGLAGWLCPCAHRETMDILSENVARGPLGSEVRLCPLKQSSGLCLYSCVPFCPGHLRQNSVYTLGKGISNSLVLWRVLDLDVPAAACRPALDVAWCTVIL